MSKNASKDFLKDLNSKIHAYVVDEINDLIKEISKNPNENKNWLYSDSEDTYKAYDIGGIAKTLCESQGPLEFKVNQEIFGKNPDSSFQDLIEFWLYHVKTEMFEDFEIFIDEFNSYDDDIPYSDQFVMMLAREAPKITYTEYFEIVKLLDEKRKQIKKENLKREWELDFETNLKDINERKLKELEFGLAKLEAAME